MQTKVPPLLLLDQIVFSCIYDFVAVSGSFLSFYLSYIDIQDYIFTILQVVNFYKLFTIDEIGWLTLPLDVNFYKIE